MKNQKSAITSNTSSAQINHHFLNKKKSDIFAVKDYDASAKVSMSINKKSIKCSAVYQ